MADVLHRKHKVEGVLEIRVADNQYPSFESFNGVNTARQECPALRLSSHAAERRQSVHDNNAEHEEKVLLMRASQWVGALCVIWFHVMGVLPHSRRQPRVPLSFMPTTQASIQQMPGRIRATLGTRVCEPDSTRGRTRPECRRLTPS